MMYSVLKTWGYVITHPKQASFDNELGKEYATQKTAVLWLTFGILLAALVTGLGSFLYETIFHSYVGSRQLMAVYLLQLPPGHSAFLDFLGSPLFGGMVSFFGILIGAPVVLLLGNLVCLGLAKALGGTGSLKKQVFATALFAPGLLIAANFFSAIRPLSICVTTPIVWLYAIVLSIIAVKSIHGLSTAKAAITVVIPFLAFTIAVLALFPPHL